MTSNIRQTFVAAATCAVEARSGVCGDFSLGADGDEINSSPMGRKSEEMDALPAWIAELPGTTENERVSIFKVIGQSGKGVNSKRFGRPFPSSGKKFGFPST
jgi:hypothetical protein